MVNVDPNNLCLVVQNLVTVLLVLHSSGHLLRSLVNIRRIFWISALLMMDYQSFSSGLVKSVQKRDEQTMGSLQPRDQVV